VSWYCDWHIKQLAPAAVVWHNSAPGGHKHKTVLVVVL